MGTLIEDIQESAQWVATALSMTGYKADFSPESLWEIDRFFDDHSREGRPKPNSLLGKQLGYRLFALGSYVGEVLRRSQGGEWEADDTDPKGEMNVALHVNGGTCWPVQRVMKRLKNGPEDGIAAYGAGLGLNVGPWRDTARKPWWKVW